MNRNDWEETTRGSHVIRQASVVRSCASEKVWCSDKQTSRSLAFEANKYIKMLNIVGHSKKP